MKVLVTGGSGVVGASAVEALLRHGLEVRVLSRHAAHDVRQWPEGVEAFPGDVSDRATLAGAGAGCDVLLHIAGIAAEKPPEQTFQRVNVEGTANILAEAIGSGIGRVVYVSSLGAERGSSEYHQSKWRAEELVRGFEGDWLILRPGNVYGPGDEVVSLLLKMIRLLPVAPVIDGGNQQFQPVWHEDLAEALAMAVERDDLTHQTLELAGEEMTSMDDLIHRFSGITGKEPPRVSVPSPLTSIVAKVAGAFGATPPVDENKLTMLREENFIRPPNKNALVGVFGISPTRLDEGLRQLADALPEQLPSQGRGPLQHKRFWADIAGSSLDAAGLFAIFRSQVNELIPIDMAAEPGAPEQLAPGITMTAELPLRGKIQMRVEEMTRTSAVLSTVEGHPIAGVIRFSCHDLVAGLRFEIDLYSRAADFFDLIALQTAGRVMQDANWNTLVERMIAVSGGVAPDGVDQLAESVDEDDAGAVDAWIEELILRRKRRESGARIASSPRARTRS